MGQAVITFDEPDGTALVELFDGTALAEVAQSEVSGLAVIELGPQGPPNQLTIETVQTGAPGSQAAVSISGGSPAQALSFVIPRGDSGSPGPANSLSIGTVTTGAPAHKLRRRSTA